MKVVKRSGELQEFSVDKLKNAIVYANNDVDAEERLDDTQVDSVVKGVIKRMKDFDQIKTEDINDLIESVLIKKNIASVAKAFILGRDKKKKDTKFSDLEQQVLTMLECRNDDVLTENANKIPTRSAVMQNYAADIILKSISYKVIPERVKKSIKDGFIWSHDMNALLLQFNCCVFDAETMLRDGFAMGVDTFIKVNDETPFSTIGLLLSQIQLNITMGQYGGQSVSMSSVIKYIDQTRHLIEKSMIEDMLSYGSAETVEFDNNDLTDIFEKEGTAFIYEKGLKYNDKNIIKFIDNQHVIITALDFEKFKKEREVKVRKEVYVFAKSYSYQIVSHLCSGQTPFTSAIMCLMEAETQQELDDYAMLIEEMLKRRMKGMYQYNMETGDKLISSPLFPKLIYFVEEGWNMNPGDPYYYLTELAAKCISLRMQPDIMSTKMSRKLKDGMIIEQMGCRSLLGPYYYEETYDINDEFYWVEMDKNAEGVHQYPYGTFVDKRSFKDIPNGKYEIGFEHGQYCINFRGNPGWVMEKTDTQVKIWRSKLYGRFNCGVTTMNIALCGVLARKEADETGGDVKEIFWRIFDEQLDIAHEAMLHRFAQVCKIKAKSSPIHWIHGALAKLKPEQTVGEFLNGRTGYASISLGYSGLCETCWSVLGVSNTTEEGHQFCIEILNHMNDLCAQWRQDNGFAPSVYGTPQENLVNNFIAAIKKVGYPIKHVTDKGYVTNSYHVDPGERGGNEGECPEIITAVKKIDLESELQNLSSGGAISYIETDDISNNPEAIIELIRYMGNHILYAEFNRVLSTCFDCGEQNTIEMRYENGQYKFRCRNCGNEEDARMDVVARICGYLGKISSHNTSNARLADIDARVIHVNCETEFPEDDYKN